MHRDATPSAGLSSPPTRREEMLGWSIGLGFTFVLFFGLAHLEHYGPHQPAVEIGDLHMVSVPLAPPPPPPAVESAPTPDTVPFSGLDVGASDSPVHIAVVPPELEALIPATREPPRGTIQSGYMHSELKPRVDVGVDVRRVYRVSEVDQPPRAEVRVAPIVPNHLFGQAHTLRVMLLLLIDPNGRAVSVRVTQSSGQPVFDEIVVQTVKNRWAFSPAIRRGKKVKCLAEQPFRVNLGAGSPFELQ